MVVESRQRGTNKTERKKAEKEKAGLREEAGGMRNAGRGGAGGICGIV